MKAKENKICQNCNLPMEYRKKWRNNWSEVKFCSKRCQKENKSKKQKQKQKQL